jgi:DNA/RNA-binding protein KIN17
MVKAERGSIKDLGNRIKSKGLQKLKYYCQMCEKQCRDANGFKCHLTSENHLRQMKIFSDNAGGILDQYSRDFEKSFMQTLRLRHGIKLVNANNVYQEMIADKQHIHMNATHWTTLSDFVQYLGKTGKCVVEETERGWFVLYIERDVSILARTEALKRREQAEKAAEEAQAQRMGLQRIEAAKALDRASKLP